MTEKTQEFDFPLQVFHEGKNRRAYDYLGLHKTEKDGKTYKNLVVQGQVIETINSKPKASNGLGSEWSELAAPF